MCSLFFITPLCLVPAHSDGNVYITDSILLQESKRVRDEETMLFFFPEHAEAAVVSPLTWQATLWEELSRGAVVFFSYLLSFQTDK